MDTRSETTLHSEITLNEEAVRHDATLRTCLAALTVPGDPAAPDGRDGTDQERNIIRGDD